MNKMDCLKVVMLSSLDAKDKALLSELLLRANDKGECWPSVERLCKARGMKHVKNFKGADYYLPGLVSIKDDGKRNNTYVINVEAVMNLEEFETVYNRNDPSPAGSTNPSPEGSTDSNTDSNDPSPADNDPAPADIDPSPAGSNTLPQQGPIVQDSSVDSSRDSSRDEPAATASVSVTSSLQRNKGRPVDREDSLESFNSSLATNKDTGLPVEINYDSLVKELPDLEQQTYERKVSVKRWSRKRAYEHVTAPDFREW